MDLHNSDLDRIDRIFKHFGIKGWIKDLTATYDNVVTLVFNILDHNELDKQRREITDALIRGHLNVNITDTPEWIGKTLGHTLHISVNVKDELWAHGPDVEYGPPVEHL